MSFFGNNNFILFPIIAIYILTFFANINNLILDVRDNLIYLNLSKSILMDYINLILNIRCL